MTKDYRSRARQPEPKQKPPLPSWIPFFYGFLAGAMLIGIAWVLLTPPGTPLVMPEFMAKSDVKTGKENNRPAETSDEPKRPRFDFYTILPEMEVVISDDENNKADTPPPDKKASTTVTAPIYRLQVGSFKKMTDADRQKARMALLGVEAEIQKVDVGQGDIFYRVLTKPIASKSVLNAKRKMFKKNGINSLVVQIKR